MLPIPAVYRPRSVSAVGADLALEILLRFLRKGGGVTVTLNTQYERQQTHMETQLHQNQHTNTKTTQANKCNIRGKVKYICESQ